MRIEAFSEAREPAHPHTNEDALVILPGRAYAVIDGVTDRNGTRYDGMLAGRYAARVVAHALTTLFATDAPAAEAVVPALTAALRAAYARHGVTPDPANWGGRMCCTLALAIPRDGDAVDVVLVGDSGIRLDGGPVLQMHKDLDQITALLRAAAWPHIRGDAVAREQIARQVVFHGIRQTIAGLDLDAIGTAAAAACHASLPSAPAATSAAAKWSTSAALAVGASFSAMPERRSSAPRRPVAPAAAAAAARAAAKALIICWDVRALCVSQ